MILLKYTDEGFMDGALTVAAPFLVGSSLILLGIRLLLLRFYPDADYTYYPRTMDSHPASEMSVPDLMDEDGMPIPKCPPPISKGGLNPFDWLLAARSITDRQILARHGLEAMMFVYISRRIAQCGTLMGALAIPLICVNGIHDQYLQDAADSDAEYFTGWPQWTIINLPKADPFTFLHSFCFAIVSTALIYASWDSLQILLTNRIIFRRSRKAYSTLDAHTVLISNLPRNLTQPSVLAYHIETAYQPDSVLAAEIVFEVPDLVKLCHKRQQVSRDLRHATNYLNVKEVRPTGKVNEHEGVCTFFRGFMDEKVDLINHYTRQVCASRIDILTQLAGMCARAHS